MKQKDILNNIFHNFENWQETEPDNLESEFRYIKEFVYDFIKMLELDVLDQATRIDLLNVVKKSEVRLARAKRSPHEEVYIKQINTKVKELKEELQYEIDRYNENIKSAKQEAREQKKLLIQVLSFIIPTLISLAALFISIFLR